MIMDKTTCDIIIAVGISVGVVGLVVLGIIKTALRVTGVLEK